MRKAWGNEITAANQEKDNPQKLHALYQRLVRKGDPHADPAAQAQSLREAFEQMTLDPEVTKRTLGQPFTHVTADALLAATKKLIAVHRREAEPDDRDDLAYQKIVGPEDLFAEQLRKAKGTLRKPTSFIAQPSQMPLCRDRTRLGDPEHQKPSERASRRASRALAEHAGTDHRGWTGPGMLRIAALHGKRSPVVVHPWPRPLAKRANPVCGFHVGEAVSGRRQGAVHEAVGGESLLLGLLAATQATGRSAIRVRAVFRSARFEFRVPAA